jgi:hypothetical protein
VTHAENQRHLRRTHCKHGHPLSGGNLRISPKYQPEQNARLPGMQRGKRSVSARVLVRAEQTLGIPLPGVPLLRSPIVFIMLTITLHAPPAAGQYLVERHVDVRGNVMLLSVDDDAMCQYQRHLGVSRPAGPTPVFWTCFGVRDHGVAIEGSSHQ